MKKNSSCRLRTLQETTVISARITIPRESRIYLWKMSKLLYSVKRGTMQTRVSHRCRLHKRKRQGTKVGTFFCKKIPYAKYSVCKYVARAFFFLLISMNISSEYFQTLYYRWCSFNNIKLSFEQAIIRWRCNVKYFFARFVCTALYYTANHFPVISLAMRNTGEYHVLAAALSVGYSRLLNPDGCLC